MPAGNPNIFNIPASAPFLRTLIRALVVEPVRGFPHLPDPLALARATIYLPTRRACRLARDMFLEVTGTEAAILPRIVAIGDIDEDEIAFAEAATGALADAALSLPPSIAPLERRLLLAELILKWANAPEVRGAGGSPLIANTPAAALGLASDLGRLIDDMATRQVSWNKLDSLVPSNLDDYWQLSLRFLKIARESWPSLLAERGLIEAVERRDLLIDAETKRLAGSNAPVIAAGSTGSMPATAKLLATIATLPHGAVVLPGLDKHLDEASWQQIAGGASLPDHDGGTPAASHAQFAMHALLDRIGIARDAVVELAPPAPHGREALVSEALRPAASTQAWQARREEAAFNSAADQACDSLTMIEATNLEEEALAIAVVLREAVQTPGFTAALVTPDRALARRVVAALERWKVPVDDSGGDSLADTQAGVFARLAVEVALGGLAPVPLLALLKHPLLRLGAAANAHDRAIAALERAVLRGPRPHPGSAALRHAFDTFRANRGGLHRSDPRTTLSDADLDAAAQLVDKLAAALEPLEQAKREDQLATFAQSHREVVTALATDAHGKIDALSGNDGRVLAIVFDELIAAPVAGGLSIAAGDYGELFHAAIGERTVRRPEIPDVRVRIFGPLEARLQTIDRMVLGGLNEGSWPPETRSDPWLSRPMRRSLGLNLPELRIGLSAHDFAQALGAREVFLTRAAKAGGAPTVSSRFVQRLAAVVGEARWTKSRARGHEYVGFARSLDRPAEVKPARRPQPTPPAEARPTKLSVTEIEHWLRDPYTIYAKHVLRLMPLEAIDTPPGARDRGTVIHGAIGAYTEMFATAPAENPVQELRALGEKHFAPLADYPEARAFWWPRFLRIADWFARWDSERREQTALLHAELRGDIEIELGAGVVFTLTTRADRIEQRKDGSYAILDYKTGTPPGHDEVKVGFAPQLTLEAAILREGGFKPLPAGGTVSELSYVVVKGGQPPGVCKIIKLKDTNPNDVADSARMKLTRIAKRFLIEGEPYLSLVHPKWKRRTYGDYDHLARVKEWQATGGELEEE